eukprot:gene4987-6234_t
MYRALTRDIEVTVEPYYLEEQSDPDDSRYVWGYRIVIANHSTEAVRLMTRYWHITDENGQVDEVSGPGVIVKLTSGIVTLSGNSDFTGPVEVQEGTVKLGNANALGSTDAGAIVSPGATLDVGGQLLPLGEVITVSGAGVGDAGAIVNTGTAGAGVGLKNLVLTGPATLGGVTRWDIRDSAGGVNVNGHTLTKGGTNTIFW